MDYDIRELGEQLMPLGMLVTLDSIFNRVIQNWKEGKTTWIFADEFYLLFRYEYSANFFYRLYKRIRKYNGFVTGLTQNVEELLKSDTARLMLANSEFLILLNQASTDREELAALLNISENQLSYITNVSVGSGLIRCSGNIVPFENTFPKNTDLYKLMTTKPGEIIMKKKEEVTITFYAAECGEFHDLGEYTKCRTLEEAYKKYQKYCRTSANMCPAIEFSIHDPESIYSDMEYPLPLSSKDRGDLELVPYYNEHPLVNEAIRQVEQLQKQQEKKKHRDVAR